MTSFLIQLSIVVRYIYCRATSLPRVLSYQVRTRSILFFEIKRKKLISAKAIYTSFGRLHSLQNDALPTKQEGVVAIKD